MTEQLNTVQSKEPLNFNEKTQVLYPTERQQTLIQCPADTIFFGGSRGGGKTYGAGLLILERVQRYGKFFHALFIRRFNPELEDAIRQFKEIFGDTAIWVSSANVFRFYNGAELKMGYIAEKDDLMKFQGHQFALIYFDEVTNFADYNIIERMRGCLRSPKHHKIPTQLIMSGNPGGPLHTQLKMEFIAPYPAGDVLIKDGFSKEKNRYLTKCFIRSRLADNPYLRDTEYAENLRKSGTAEQVKQWLDGDWDVCDNSAFGSLFDSCVHVVKPFQIPTSWYISKSYDYGSSHPWGCVWFAESDGTDYTDRNGVVHSTIPGDVFAVYELYGWTGRPNEGTKESIESQSEKIKLVEERYFSGYNIIQSIADSAIFADSSGSYCIARDFEENGVYWERCNKYPGSRQHGYALLRDRIMASREREEKPGIFWFERCVNSIRTIPMLQMDRRGEDKVETGNSSEDHLYDLTMYYLLSQDTGLVSSGASNNY